MAFAITNKTINVAPDWSSIGRSTDFQFVSTATATSTSNANRYFELGDYTSTQYIPASSQDGTIAGGIGDFGAAHLNYRAQVWLKSLTTTSTSGNGLVHLFVATSTAFSPQIPIASQPVPTTSTSAAMTLWGTAPLSGGYQYARIGFTFTGSTTGGAINTATFGAGIDAIITAV